MLSAKEAATAVGMSKAGIIRAIHTGKLSATRNANQQFEIDPAELFRVYAPVGNPLGAADNLSWEVAGNLSRPEAAVPLRSTAGATRGAARQSDGVDDKVAMLERIIRDKDETLADLRQRLDVATEQNTRLEAVLAAQLLPPQPGTRPRGLPVPSWWQRLLGG